MIDLDKQDPLRHLAEHFHKPKGLVYLDGNSLGLMPKGVAKHLENVIQQQWANDLIASWNTYDWIDLPSKVGDKIGDLIGAGKGQVVCCDSISINLFKVLAFALQLNASRNQVLSTQDNFPTDLYMVQGLTNLIGEARCQLNTVDENSLIEAITHETAVVIVTQVNFRTGNIVDIEKVTAKAKSVGALVIVDLAHSAGVLPVELDQWQVDFAVGCTYKYLNAGPGAPGFAYVSNRYHGQMNQPLYGWMGHASGFAFSPQYVGARDSRQLLTGTPPILSLSAVDKALDVYQGVSIEIIRDKSKKLTDYFLQCLQEKGLADTLACISPLDSEQRGSQLSFRFDYAYPLCQALIAQKVVADFRAPHFIRFGFSPLYNSFEEVNRAVNQIASVLNKKSYLQDCYNIKNRVT